MKKLLAILFTFGLILTLSACDMDDLAENNPPVSGASSETVLGEDGTTSGIVDSQIVSDTNASVSNVTQQITRDGAIEIALNHAGFKQNEVINLTAELDKEISHSEWEVEFDKDNYEYSYEINATTGEIIKNEKEIKD